VVRIVLAYAVREIEHTLEDLMKHFLFWAPRILAALYAAFLSLFAFDVFGQYAGLRQTAIAFTIHLIPAGIVLALFALSFWWARISGISFLLAGLAYAAIVGLHPSWIAVIAGPLFVIGMLFLLTGGDQYGRTHSTLT
jgi:hypothetical protein